MVRPKSILAQLARPTRSAGHTNCDAIIRLRHLAQRVNQGVKPGFHLNARRRQDVQRPTILCPVQLHHRRAEYVFIVAHRQQQTSVSRRELLPDDFRRCGDERIVAQRSLDILLNVRPECRRFVLTHFVDCDHSALNSAGITAGQYVTSTWSFACGFDPMISSTVTSTSMSVSRSVVDVSV